MSDELPIRIENYRLGREVVQRILQESATYTQIRWTHLIDACTTPACIAGHAVAATLQEQERLGINDVIDSKGTPKIEIHVRAESVLGLDQDDGNLFSPRPLIGWPYPYNEQYANAPTPEARAKVAADLLERLADEAEERERREA